MFLNFEWPGGNHLSTGDSHPKQELTKNLLMISNGKGHNTCVVLLLKYVTQSTLEKTSQNLIADCKSYCLRNLELESSKLHSHGEKKIWDYLDYENLKIKNWKKKVWKIDRILDRKTNKQKV